jgi:putative transcriptional regulator
MQPLKGHLLIATPQLETTIFARSVILMLEASEQAAAGVILNQPIKTTLTELSGKIFAEDFEWDKSISLGGPKASSLMVLHNQKHLADKQVIPGVYFTVEPSKVHELVEQRPEPSLVLANYSAWGPGQLDGELKRDSWLTLPATPKQVFWTGEQELWKAVFSEVRTRNLARMLRIRQMPADPGLN